MLRAALACFALVVTLDRVVISVGLDAITQSQLNEELAVTAFLNREPMKDTLVQRRAAAHRLVQQALIARDMQLAHFPGPESTQVDRAMARIVEEYGGERDFRGALLSYRISESVLRSHIQNQIATLRFIEYRFRPDLTISEGEIRSAYDHRTANWNQEHPGVAEPGFEESRAAIRSDLIEQRTDEALDKWLNQTASQTQVVYIDPSLAPQK